MRKLAFTALLTLLGACPASAATIGIVQHSASISDASVPVFAELGIRAPSDNRQVVVTRDVSGPMPDESVITPEMESILEEGGTVFVAGVEGAYPVSGTWGSSSPFLSASLLMSGAYDVTDALLRVDSLALGVWGNGSMVWTLTVIGEPVSSPEPGSGILAILAICYVQACRRRLR